MAVKLDQPTLQELCCRYIYSQTHPDIDPDDIDLDDCPFFNGSISRFQSGRATFFAPSEESGASGMHSEMVRSNSEWRNEYPRYDTVLVQNGDNDDPLHGMLVARVLAFLQFVYDDVRYDTALVEWFLPVGDVPDPVTGMWIVKPEMHRGRRKVELIHIGCIVRGCQLIGVYGKHPLPIDFHFSYSLNAFRSFYVNQYIDYHAHECIP